MCSISLRMKEHVCSLFKISGIGHCIHYGLYLSGCSTEVDFHLSHSDILYMCVLAWEIIIFTVYISENYRVCFTIG